MVCEFNTDPTNRICQFSANYAINSFLTGRVSFVDCDCVDGPVCGDLCLPFCVGVDAELRGQDFEDATLAEIQACYNESPRWLSGLLSSFGFDYKSSISTFSVLPFSEYLTRKPINTQQFRGSNLSEVIPTILKYYSGVTPDYLCIGDAVNGWNFTDNTIRGPIEGNNTLTEVAKLAQAGCASLFTQVGGCLTIEPWKDHNSPTEFVIPCEYIITANKAEYTASPINGIRIRGAEVSSLECGETALTRNDNGPGNVKKCAFSGIKTTQVNMKFNQLSGTQEDVNNSTINLQGSNGTYTATNVNSNSDGTGSSTLSAPGGRSIGCEPECIDLIVTGRNQSLSEEGRSGKYSGYGYNEYGGYGWGTNNPSFFDRYAQVLNNLFPVPYYMFGLGNFANALGPRNNSNTNGNFSDQPSRSQTEMFVTTDDNLECGVGFEDHENTYVDCKETLFKIAVRRFQETRLANNTWNVELPYLPCLRVNQVVEFDTIATETCPSERIRGIVGGLNIEHKKSSSGDDTVMRAAIMDLECLGQTQYTSGNLIQTLCAADASSDLNPWQSAAYGLESGSSINDCMFLYAAGQGQSFLTYEHPKADTSCQYTLSFDWIRTNGSGIVNFSSTDTSTLFTEFLGGAFDGPDFGTFTQQFTANSNTFTLDWQLTFPTTPTYFKITNLRLVATCIG